MKKQGKKNPPPRRRKRLRRIILGAFLFLFLFIGIGLIVLWRLYPSEKLGALVSEKLSVSLGRPVQVKQVSINPFGKIEVRDIDIGFLEDEGPDGQSFFQMNQLTVHFKLFPLLRRRLDITRVLIDQPKLYVVPNILQEAIEQEKEIEAEVVMESEEKELLSAEEISLPLSFGLFDLVLNDFSFTVTVGDSSREGELVFSGIQLAISDLALSRRFTEEPEKVRGQIHLFTQEGRAVLENRETTSEAIVDLDLSAEWHSGKQWAISGDIGFQMIDQGDQSKIHLSLDLEGVGYGETIRISRLDLTGNQQKLIHLEGVLDHLDSDAEYDLTFQSDPINLNKIEQVFNSYVYLIGVDLFKDMHVSGLFRLERGELWGDSQNMQLLCQAQIENGSIQSQSDLLDIHRGDFTVVAEGALTQKGLGEGKISGNFIIDRFAYTMHDSYSVSVEDISINADTQLDSTVMPSDGSFYGHIDDILGGSLNLGFEWEPEDEGVFENGDIILTGQMRADSLQLESLPNMDPRFRGQIDFVTNVNTHGLKDIRINMIGLSQGIDYNIGSEINRTPPLEMVVNMAWNTDNKFNEWKLDRAAVQLNELFSARLVGELDVSEKDYSFSLTEGVVRNEFVSDFLPMGLRDQFKTMAFHGEEEIALQVSGHRATDSAIVMIEGNVDLDSVEVDYPAQLLNVNGIQGSLSFKGSSKKIDGTGEFTLGSVSHENIWPEPVLGSRIQFDWGMIEQDSLWIDRGNVHIEPLGIRGDIFLGMGQMTQSRNMDAEAELVFFSDDSVEVIQGTWLQGRLSCYLKGETIDPINQWFNLSGKLIVDSLNVRKDSIVNIKQMHGIIPFQLDVDIDRQELLPETNIQALSWVEYGNQRTVYQNLAHQIGNLRIQQIDVSGYRLTDLVFDFNVEGGHVQIPWFNMELFEGNGGGFIGINLRDGSKSNISYEIRANFSRLNSAALAEITNLDKEETELNASLAFQGKGIDLEQEIDLDGFFHITKIGADFAGTLLKAMDPQETDRSIRLTRRLLNMGWKPKLFSFELRHGYVYPSLALTQPWYSPLRIPEYLEYGRLPLAFFLQSQSNQK